VLPVVITSSLNVAFFLSSELFFHPRFLSFLREIKQSRRIRIAEHSAFIVADQIDDTLSAEFANNFGAKPDSKNRTYRSAWKRCATKINCNVSFSAAFSRTLLKVRGER
jgi:hypothetical protein